MGFTGIDDIIYCTTELGQTEWVDWSKVTDGGTTGAIWSELFSEPGTPGPGYISNQVVFGFTSNSAPKPIVMGPDGKLWIGSSNTARVDVITPGSGGVGYCSMETYTATGASGIRGICVGPDNNLWITYNNHKVAKWTTAGVETVYSCTGSALPWGICVGSDGNLWVAYTGTHKVAKWTTAGVETVYSCTGSSSPTNICLGSDNRVWVCYDGTDKIAAFDTSGTETVYNITASPGGICLGSDNRVWVTNSTGVSAFTTSGVETFYSSSTLVSSQSICLGSDGKVYASSTSAAGSLSGFSTSGTETVCGINGNYTSSYGICPGLNNDLFITDVTQSIVTRVLIGDRGVARVCNKTSPGSLQLGSDVSPSTRHLLNMQALSTSTVLGTLMLVDFLLIYPDVRGNTVTTLDNTATLPRYIDGIGVMGIVVVSAGTNSATHSIGVTYTGSDNAGYTTTMTGESTSMTRGSLYRSSTAATAGGPFIPLQGSVQGIKSIDSYTIVSASSSTSALSFVLVKPIATLQITAQYQLAEVEYLNQFLSLPKIEDGACLGFLFAPSIPIVATTPLSGRLQFVWGP